VVVVVVVLGCREMRSVLVEAVDVCLRAAAAEQSAVWMAGVVCVVSDGTCSSPTDDVTSSPALLCCMCALWLYFVGGFARVDFQTAKNDLRCWRAEEEDEVVAEENYEVVEENDGPHNRRPTGPVADAVVVVAASLTALHTTP
jgi:hypothetical protein